MSTVVSSVPCYTALFDKGFARCLKCGDDLLVGEVLVKQDTLVLTCDCGAQYLGLEDYLRPLDEYYADFIILYYPEVTVLTKPQVSTISPDLFIQAWNTQPNIELRNCQHYYHDSFLLTHILKSIIRKES